jgi:aryl-alcohol dehydrogenase-like predicted oxidoreductase
VELKPFGNTDLRVSPICLGTMQFGWTADEDASFAVMDAYVAAGGNFLDSADIYSNWAPDHGGGESEEIIGRWLKARDNRNRIVIATKVRGPMWQGSDGEGLSRAHISHAVEDSLRRLQVDTIDLYQCHWPDEGTPIEETLAVFQELIDAGKVRYIGASNYDVKLLRAALRSADEKQLARFASLQPHYNLVHRSEYEAQLQDVCGRERIGVIPYSPLAGGFLTGKYRPGRPLPKSSRADRAKSLLSGPGLRVLAALDPIALGHRVSLASIALAWLLANPTVTAPIIGANSPEQLAELLPAVELKLSQAELTALDTASHGT